MIDSTLYHCDTLIEGKHIIIDTTIKNDTVYVETQTFDKEIQVIEKLIEHKDFGKGICSILVLVFVVYCFWSKRKCTK